MSEKQNYSDVEFEALLGNYDYNFKKGDLVNGIVCGYDSDGALVDIGSKTSASVSSNEITLDKSKSASEVLEKGKNYEFLIISDEDVDGKLQLSYLKVQQAYTWKELEKLKESNETILGKIASIVKGGLIVDILGVRGFVPSSQLKIKDQEFKIGEELELKILTLDSQQNSFILSNKKVYLEASEEEKKNLFAQIEIGHVVKGSIVRITDFGAFVDIGGVEGLLPLSQISWKWIDHPSDLLKLGQEVEVEIISIDADKQRVSLSLKNLEPDPWIEAEKNIQEGGLYEGVITRMKSFGAFVEIYTGVEALLPQNELLEYENQNNSIPKVGETIKTYVLKFNAKDKRIALSVTQPEFASV